MVFLFALILIGYLVAKFGVVPKSTSEVLAKLENNIFIPALVLGTFLKHFTVDTLQDAWKLLLVGFAIAFVSIPITKLICRAVTKDQYVQKIYTYGLVFSNFGFMGNAVVMAIFPDYFDEYLIFALAFWTVIYLVGVPRWLIPNDSEGKPSLKSNLMKLVNPMFIAMLVGMILGIVFSSFNIVIAAENPVMKVITVAGDCMSPIAMLITGITIAGYSFKKMMTNIGVYVISIFRLLVYPLVALGVFVLLRPLNVSREIVVCTMCFMAMPLGLNTIVVPSAYGKDTSVAAGMALISHLLSIGSIPLIFMLVDRFLL
ncbi:MAG: AEC family transporter [Clostridia bacterium]|nr:AEC family transporter [Clostridia bacterium]